MNTLTARQFATLLYIHEYQTTHRGQSPQVKEIAHYFNVSSPAISNRLLRLAAAGYIRYRPHFPPRVLRVPDMSEIGRLS